MSVENDPMQVQTVAVAVVARGDVRGCIDHAVARYDGMPVTSGNEIPVLGVDDGRVSLGQGHRQRPVACQGIESESVHRSRPDRTSDDA